MTLLQQHSFGKTEKLGCHELISPWLHVQDASLTLNPRCSTDPHGAEVSYDGCRDLDLSPESQKMFSFQSSNINKWLTGRGWFWQGQPYSQKRRSTVPGQECRSCRPLLQPPHHYGNRCLVGIAVPGRSVPHGAGSAAGMEQSVWWASVQWYWSGRSHLERERHFSFLHLTVMLLTAAWPTQQYTGRLACLSYWTKTSSCFISACPTFSSLCTKEA